MSAAGRTHRPARRHAIRSQAPKRNRRPRKRASSSMSRPSSGRTGAGDRCNIAQPVQVRWQDLDPLGHVGHVACLGYFEEARNALLAQHGLPVEEHVMASISVNYRREIASGTALVTASSRLERLGSSSLTTLEELHGPDGELLADCTAWSCCGTALHAGRAS